MSQFSIVRSAFTPDQILWLDQNPCVSGLFRQILTVTHCLVIALV